MQLVAQSSLQAVEPIADRPVLALPSNQVGLDPANDRVIAAARGGGSDALRLIASRRGDAVLERTGDNNPRGPIIGTPAIARSARTCPSPPSTAGGTTGSAW